MGRKFINQKYFFSIDLLNGEIKDMPGGKKNKKKKNPKFMTEKMQMSSSPCCASLPPVTFADDSSVLMTVQWNRL